MKTRARRSSAKEWTTDEDATRGVDVAESQCANESEDRSACFKFREDYVECLHHRKEYARENEVAAEIRRRSEATLEEMRTEMRTMSWVNDPKYAPPSK